MKLLLPLIYFVIISGCGSERVQYLDNNQDRIFKILFTENPCDSINIVNDIIAKYEVDSAMIEDVSMLYVNCHKHESAISLIKSGISKGLKPSETELLRLCEAYRTLQDTDNALYYLNEFQKNCTQASWTEAQFNLWRMQINFEASRYDATIYFAQLAIASPEGIGDFRKEWPHEYIVHSLIELNKEKEACDYAKKHVPQFYAYMKYTLCK